VKSKQEGANPGGGGQINKSSQASSTANITNHLQHQVDPFAHHIRFYASIETCAWMAGVEIPQCCKDMPCKTLHQDFRKQYNITVDPRGWN
jgi:hypothetical protein